MNVPPTPSTKRPRAPSSPSSSLSISPGSADPPSKASRMYIPHAPPGSGDGLGLYASGAEGTTTGPHSSTKANPAGTGAQHTGITNTPLLCSLPPTCHHRPTPIANTAELESHYAKYHAHVCAESGCGCVFPEARLLALHQTECHDPLAMIRKERGEKIFECHIPTPTCGRKFLTPKARRLHLIQAHGYPKAFFFAVTNKGIGGLLRRWGEGASMVRGTWKPREEAEKGAQKYRDRDDDAMDEDEDEDDDSDDDNDSHDGKGDSAAAYDDEDLEATPRMLPRTAGIPPVHSPPSSIGSGTTAQGTHTSTHKPPANAHPHPHGKQKQKQKQKQKHQKQEYEHERGGKPAPKAASGAADSLADSMSSLSLVPTSIRFGRGGKTGGFAPPPHAQLAHSSQGGTADHSAHAARGARGLGPRGRGRGRGRIDGVGADGAIVHDDTEPFTGPPQGSYDPRGTRGQVSRARARARGMRGFGRGA